MLSMNVDPFYLSLQTVTVLNLFELFLTNFGPSKSFTTNFIIGIIQSLSSLKPGFNEIAKEEKAESKKV